MELYLPSSFWAILQHLAQKQQRNEQVRKQDDILLSRAVICVSFTRFGVKIYLRHDMTGGMEEDGG